MKNTQLAWNIFTAPSAAFAELKERPSFWWPLLAIVISAAALAAWYYSIVDIRWLMEQTLSGSGAAARLTEEQRAQAIEHTSRGMMLGSSVIFGALAVAAIKLLEALYYSLAGKVTNVERSFRHWLTLACWSSLPSLLGVIASAALLLAADTNQIDAGSLAALSLNELFFQVPMSGKGYSLLTTLTLLQPWMWWLTALGVRVWTGRSWTFSALFALIPVVVGYGAWAAFSLS